MNPRVGNDGCSVANIISLIVSWMWRSRPGW